MSNLSLTSIYTQLGQKAQKPIAIALGLGLTASSFMLFSNVGVSAQPSEKKDRRAMEADPFFQQIAMFGVMPAASDAEKRKRAKLTTSQGVRL